MQYTVHTVLSQLLNDERARAILEKHRPGATSHPQLYEALHLSLLELSAIPETNLSAEDLQALLADLNQETSNSQKN